MPNGFVRIQPNNFGLSVNLKIKLILKWYQFRTLAKLYIMKEVLPYSFMRSGTANGGYNTDNISLLTPFNEGNSASIKKIALPGYWAWQDWWKCQVKLGIIRIYNWLFDQSMINCHFWQTFYTLVLITYLKITKLQIRNNSSKIFQGPSCNNTLFTV